MADFLREQAQTEEERWQHLNALDDDLLEGGEFHFR
jgi:hypothetical protein